MHYKGGLSRGGLLYPEKPGGPRNDYAGHVFWDMDTWVMPPMMLFNPTMARHMVKARTRVLEQAKKNAVAEGFKGAKFPWEQASTGLYSFYFIKSIWLLICPHVPEIIHGRHLRAYSTSKPGKSPYNLYSVGAT